jgi:mannose-1-phosphate guanylyltransferase
VRALLLAAGRGERLRPLTETVPKPLVEVGGRPLIHYPLAMLRRAGITEVAVNVHHLAGRMESALGSGASLGMSITWSPEPELLGTGGPLSVLRDYLAGDRFVIANSDSILDLDLSAMIARHRERGALATLALARPDNLAYYSTIEIDSAERIRRIRLLARREPLRYDDYPGDLDDGAAARMGPWMYCGVIVAEPAVLSEIPARAPWSLMSGLFAPMVAKGLPLFGHVHRGYFRTVDDLKSYEALRAEFESNPPRLSGLD